MSRYFIIDYSDNVHIRIPTPCWWSENYRGKENLGNTIDGEFTVVDVKRVDHE